MRQPAHDDAAVESHADHEASERLELLEQLQEMLDGPMLVLAFVWLALFIVEATVGLTPLLAVVGYVIWAVFILDFLVRLVVAPRKGRFLAGNWLTALALVVPALRMLRAVQIVRVARLSRAASVARGARLVRVFGTLNRGMRALRATMRRRGFAYVTALTLIVVLAGAAGMYAFEADEPGTVLDSYGSAVWWTAMLITTMGSDYWPRSPEGRALCFMLSLFAFGVFGYVTATLASYFVGQDNQRDANVADRASIEALRAEIAALRAELLDTRK